MLPVKSFCYFLMIDLPPDCQAALRDPVMQQIYQVESGFNPFAIGVVGGRLVRQPNNLAEAVATANYLTNLDRNFSIGQGQVNKTHFVRLGWDSDIKAGFDVCKNVVAAYEIFQQCQSWAIGSGFNATQEYSATNAALSCYYSGKLGAGKTNPDVTRYINKVISSTPRNPVNMDSASLVIPLASSEKGKITNVNADQTGVRVKVVKPQSASMLLSGNSSVSNTTSSMMLINQAKD
ncbi:type IV secretion system protein VirB1 [Nitrosomonas eutropha]|uniref:Type IV secretion system protein VirB1 n=2 Tax=Nitrosomonas eutropha TaxID=916 RepID=A0A1I7FC43_9PROT|nr:type IV secretion system protein VirB1 [Nitrosomonas eutropha]